MGYFRRFSLLGRPNFAADKNLINMKKYLSLNFRADWFEAIETFPEDRQLDAYRAIMRYAFYGEIPSDPSIKMAIGLIMLLIDKRRSTRKPKDSTVPAPNAHAPAQSAESKDIQVKTSCRSDVDSAVTDEDKTVVKYSNSRQNSALDMKPVVVKSIPVHNAVRDVRRARRAVCRSSLSNDFDELSTGANADVGDSAVRADSGATYQ